MKTTFHTQLFMALLVVVLTVASSSPAGAYDFMVDSIAYNYNSNDSTTVSVVPISKTEYYKGDIVIPETVSNDGNIYKVTSIGSRAFAFCTQLASISLPSSIVVIEDAAFLDCHSLTDIDLPEGLKVIGAFAFCTCTNLQSIIIPNSVEVIHYLAFMNDCNLKTVVLPSSLEMINEKTFEGCTNLKDVNLPISLKSIKADAFNGCQQFSTVVVPDSVVEIGNHAFNGCRNVKEVTIGKSVKRISISAFSDCRWIEVLKWNAEECEDFDDSEVSPFRPYGTQFSVVIGNNVKRIPSRLLRYSITLKSIDIPASVTEIGNSALDTCLYLETIVSRIPAPSLISYGFDLESIFNGVDKDECVVFVPAGTIDEYKATMPWSAFSHFEEIVDNDIDCDGAVTAADVTMQYNQILNNDYTSPSTCDVDGDGEVTAADITKTYNTILGNQ